MQQAILDQITAYPHFHPNVEIDSSDTIIAKCIERVRHEGNSHLLEEQELPAILQGQKRRVELMLSKRSWGRKAIHETRQAYRLGKLIHPNSRIMRAAYQIRHSADMLQSLNVRGQRRLRAIARSLANAIHAA